jgi:hypothetical protein
MLPLFQKLPNLLALRHIADFPKPIGHASGHRSCNAQHLMDPNEIVTRLPRKKDELLSRFRRSMRMLGESSRAA